MREFAPEHTSYKGLLCFQTYDLTALLHIGENVLGMEVGDGWYCCPQTQPPIDGLQPDHTVLFQLEIENADGTHTRICSDEGVLTHESAVRASDILMENSMTRVWPCPAGICPVLLLLTGCPLSKIQSRAIPFYTRSLTTR